MLNTETKEARFCPFCGLGKPDNYPNKFKCPSCGEEFLVVDPEDLEALEAEADKEKLEDDDRERLEWLKGNEQDLAECLNALLSVDDAIRAEEVDELSGLSSYGRSELRSLILSLESLP